MSIIETWMVEHGNDFANGIKGDDNKTANKADR
jgi:hypothetical protein